MKYRIVQRGDEFLLQCQGFATWKCYGVRGFYDWGNPWSTDRVFKSLQEAEDWIEANKPECNCCERVENIID